MIKFNNLSQEKPYLIFKEKYDQAFEAGQKNIEAISISSFSERFKEVNARYVNLKIIIKKDFIFFTNYESPKSQDFKNHKQITALIFWNTINTQIRIKALIKKTSKDFNQEYFSNRCSKKNALAISSKQSALTDAHANVVENYKKSLQYDNLSQCPDYWGGFKFTPYYFEFWEGHNLRLNKRDVYEINNEKWTHVMLQP